MGYRVYPYSGTSPNQSSRVISYFNVRLKYISNPQNGKLSFDFSYFVRMTHSPVPRNTNLYSSPTVLFDSIAN